MKKMKLLVLCLVSIMIMWVVAFSVNAASGQVNYTGVYEKYNGSYYYNQAYANVTITGSGTCNVTVRLFKNGALRASRTTPVSAPQTCTCYSDTLQGTGATFGNVTFS